MIRTQIYIPEDEHRDLQLMAKQKNASMAEIIRTFIKTALDRDKQRDSSGKSIMRSLAKLKLKGGPRDLSVNLDHYLYGKPKKQP